MERFWRTLNDDLIEGTMFANLEEFKDELISTSSITIRLDPTRH